MKLRLIFLACAVSLFTLASCRDKLTGPPNTTSSDTIAYWTFDGNAHDVSGNGHDATITGNYNYIKDRFTATFGTEDNRSAISFAGAGEMSVSNMPVLNDNDSYSISAWVNFTVNGGILSQTYGFGADTAGWGADLAGCGTILSSTSVGIDHWHLLTLAVAAHSTATLYIDSVAVASKGYGSYSGDNSNQPLQILFNQTNLASSLKDTTRVDDVLMLHRCMTAIEVSNRFHEGGWTGGPHVLSDTQSIELLTNTSDTLNGTIAMSGDGMRVACAASDQAVDATQGFIYVFDAIKGTVIRKIAKGSWAGHFQLDNGGNQLLLWEGGGAGNATLFNVLTGGIIRTFGADAGQGDFSAALTSSGDSVLIFKEYYASGNGTVAFYDSKTGTLLSSYATPLNARFVTLTNADRSIVLLSQDSMTIMNAQTGSWSSSYFSHIGTWVSYWELPSPDGVLIGGYDNASSSFRIVNTKTGSEVSAPNIGNDAFALSNDHTTMAHATSLSSANGTISFQIDIIKIADGSEVKQLSNLDGTFAGGAYLVYSNDGSRLAGECYNGVKVWKIK